MKTFIKDGNQDPSREEDVGRQWKNKAEGGRGRGIHDSEKVLFEDREPKKEEGRGRDICMIHRRQKTLLEHEKNKKKAGGGPHIYGTRESPRTQES